MHKLIIVEGLTGSGKSIMAQFVSRQFKLAGYQSEWVHEAAFNHPLSVDDEEDIEVYKRAVKRRWAEFVENSLAEDRVMVFEACYFNNCLETLFIHNEPFPKILDFALQLEEILNPLNPCLIYLVQQDTRHALEVNFANRGEGFKNFVINFSVNQPVSLNNNWQGEAGMLTFWEKFVELTNQAYDLLSIKKLRIDNARQDYITYENQVLKFLGLTFSESIQPPKSLVREICGDYHPISGHKQDVSFRIYEDNQVLMAGFLHYNSKLIYIGGSSFEAAGWYFIFEFERSKGEEFDLLSISGKDVEYLILSGIRAKKIS